MEAMVLDRICDMHKNPHPLKRVELPEPEPDEGEVLLKVAVCGVCHTELDEIEGRTPPPIPPTALGHQVLACGAKVLTIE